MPFLLLRCLRRRSVEFFEKIQEQIRENSAAHECLWIAGIAPSGYDYRELSVGNVSAMQISSARLQMAL